MKWLACLAAFFFAILTGRALAGDPETFTVSGHEVKLWVAGKGGAPLFDISDSLIGPFIAGGNTAQIWVIEGGINDVFWWGASQSDLETRYINELNAIRMLALGAGAERIFVQELTPVIPAIIDNYIPWTMRSAPNLDKIVRLNQLLNDWAPAAGVTVVPVFQDFLPHWNTDDATTDTAKVSWCIWQSDSVHPNALGCHALGQAWARAVGATIVKDTSIAIFGDSIVDAASFGVADKPGTWFADWLPKYAPPNAAKGVWRWYE